MEWRLHSVVRFGLCCVIVVSGRVVLMLGLGFLVIFVHEIFVCAAVLHRLVQILLVLVLLRL